VLISEFHVDYDYAAQDGGATALVIAAWSGNKALVKYLLGQGADTTKKGRLLQTSACGGVGPFTAREWARRKSEVCPCRPEFKACYKMLLKEESSHPQRGYSL